MEMWESEEIERVLDVILVSLRDFLGCYVSVLTVRSLKVRFLCVLCWGFGSNLPLTEVLRLDIV